MRNLPNGTRPGMTPPFRWNAASVCGTPLPRTSGNSVASNRPVITLTYVGTRNNRTLDGARPKKR